MAWRGGAGEGKEGVGEGAKWSDRGGGRKERRKWREREGNRNGEGSR